MATYDKQLTELAGAPSVAFGPVGFAAHTLPATEAYFDLAEAGDPALIPRLERLLDGPAGSVTPAGKVYAAALLDLLDPAAGRRAWQRLSSDPAQVSTFAGCMMGSTTLAGYAAGRLASPTRR